MRWDCWCDEVWEKTIKIILFVYNLIFVFYFVFCKKYVPDVNLHSGCHWWMWKYEASWDNEICTPWRKIYMFFLFFFLTTIWSEILFFFSVSDLEEYYLARWHFLNVEIVAVLAFHYIYINVYCNIIFISSNQKKRLKKLIRVVLGENDGVQRGFI
jgi:hypothetical protein